MGFNGGSALAANGLAGSAILVSNTAAAAAMIAWVILDTINVGKPTVLGAITGAVAGLVAITPAAGFVDVFGALVIGAISPIISYFAIYYIKPKLGYDDALDVWGIHGMSGIWGAIATGIFAVPTVGGVAGLVAGNPEQVVIQLISVVATLAYSFVISFVLAKVLDKAMGGIRVEEREEIGGLDMNLHEESAYNLN
jgi:Amt family ammonium transporter